MQLSNSKENGHAIGSELAGSITEVIEQKDLHRNWVGVGVVIAHMSNRWNGKIGARGNGHKLITEQEIQVTRANGVNMPQSTLTTTPGSVISGCMISSDGVLSRESDSELIKAGCMLALFNEYCKRMWAYLV